MGQEIINPIRHLSVFDPDAFGNRRVDIIGAGATGSRVALSLAKLGLRNLHVWDFDSVESHNIANQAFSMSHIGSAKTQALAQVIETGTGLTITVHEEKVDGSQSLGEVVFLLTDTMASRKEIWEKGLKLKPRTQVLIETRMGAAEGRVYTLCPSRRTHIAEYEQTFYSDAVAETSACGASVSVGPTAEFLSGLAVWQFLKWFKFDQAGEGDPPEFESIFGLTPMLFFCNRTLPW